MNFHDMFDLLEPMFFFIWPLRHIFLLLCIPWPGPELSMAGPRAGRAGPGPELSMAGPLLNIGDGEGRGRFDLQHRRRSSCPLAVSATSTLEQSSQGATMLMKVSFFSSTSRPNLDPRPAPTGQARKMMWEAPINWPRGPIVRPIRGNFLG
jgi:hypothetical protein